MTRFLIIVLAGLAMTPCVASAQLQARPFLTAALVGVGARSSAFTPRESIGARVLFGVVSPPRGAFALLGAIGLGASSAFGDGDCVVDLGDVPNTCRSVQGSLYHASALVGGEASNGRFAADLLVGPSVLSASSRVVLASETRHSVGALHGHLDVRGRVGGPLWIAIMGDALSGSNTHVRSAGLGFRVEQRVTKRGAP